MKKLTILLDIDDTLMVCCEPAAEIVRREKGYNIRFEDMKEWGFTYHPEYVQKAMFEVMNRDEFIRSQRPNPGAVELVKKLQKMGHTVIIYSSVKPRQMGVRAEAILRWFPIPESNIVLGGHKNLMKADVILDDALLNVKRSNCTYPVLMRRPWNENEDVRYAVRNFDEFMLLVEKFADEDEPGKTEENPYVVLVGPSASGKTTIIKELVRDPRFTMVTSVTSRKPRPDESGAEYQFVSREKFEQMVREGQMLEHTEYADNYYGTSKSAVQQIWDKGLTPVSAMDICGAKATKSAFGNRALIVFIRRGKADILNALLSRDCPKEDIIRRIMTLDEEYQNALLCDVAVENNGTIEQGVERLKNRIKMAQEPA